MTDEKGKRLYDGIERLMRTVVSGPSQSHGLEIAIRGPNNPERWCHSSIDWLELDAELPPLCPIRAFALSVLIDPTHVKAGALVDLLREAGVITGEWEDAVRKDEASKVLARFFITPVNEIHTWPELSFSFGTITTADIANDSWLQSANLNPVVTQIPPEPEDGQ